MGSNRNLTKKSGQCRKMTRIGGRMAQIPQNRGNSERSRFAFYSDHEVRYWTERLGVSAEDVRAAVKRVRAMVEGSRRDTRR